MNSSEKVKRNSFQEFMDFVDEIVKVLCIVLMFAMLFCILLQVVTRYILPFSLSWTEELARYIMMWLIFLGASHIAKASSYISVNFLLDKMPAGIKNIFSVFIKLIVLGTSGYFAYNCFVVFTTIGAGEISPAMQISLMIPKYSFIVGFILVFLQALSAGGFKMLPNEEEDEQID